MRAWPTLFGTALVLCACGTRPPVARRAPTPPSSGGQVWVVRFDDGGVTADELAALVRGLPEYQREHLTAAQLRRLADLLGTEALLVQEAKRLGLDRDPEVLATGKKEQVSQLLRLVIEDPALNDVPDAEVEARLEALLDGGGFDPAREFTSATPPFDYRPDRPPADIPRTLDQARTEVRQAIVDQRRRARYDKLVKSLFAAAHVQIDEQALARVPVPDAGLSPAAEAVYAHTREIPAQPPKWWRDQEARKSRGGSPAP